MMIPVQKSWYLSSMKNMKPAYDLESHPSMMSFRTDEHTPHGAFVFVVYDNLQVGFYSPEFPNMMFSFNCSQSEYDEWKEIYWKDRFK